MFAIGLHPIRDRVEAYDNRVLQLLQQNRLYRARSLSLMQFQYIREVVENFWARGITVRNNFEDAIGRLKTFKIDSALRVLRCTRLIGEPEHMLSLLRLLNNKTEFFVAGWGNLPTTISLPQTASIYLEYGYAYQTENELNKALFCCWQAIVHQPGLREADNALDRLQGIYTRRAHPEQHLILHNLIRVTPPFRHLAPAQQPRRPNLQPLFDLFGTTGPVARLLTNQPDRLVIVPE